MLQKLLTVNYNDCQSPKIPRGSISSRFVMQYLLGHNKVGQGTCIMNWIAMINVLDAGNDMRARKLYSMIELPK